MRSEKHQRYYSCGHPRPQGPVSTIIAHAKPLLHPHSKLEPVRQNMPPPHDSSSHAAPTPAVVFTNPFNDSRAPPLPPSHSSSASSSRSNSITRVSGPSPNYSPLPRHELTPEERVATGLEYMHAFLASRSRSSSASGSPVHSVTPIPEARIVRRAAIGAA